VNTKGKRWWSVSSANAAAALQRIGRSAWQVICIAAV
jgi:hypothetical protein